MIRIARHPAALLIALAIAILVAPIAPADDQPADRAALDEASATLDRAIAHWKAQRYDQTLKALRHARALFKRGHGADDHEDLIAVHAMIATTHDAAGRPDRAIAAFSTALAMLERLDRRDHDVIRGDVHLELARLLEATGKTDLALDHALNGVRLLRKAAGGKVYTPLYQRIDPLLKMAVRADDLESQAILRTYQLAHHYDQPASAERATRIDTLLEQIGNHWADAAWPDRAVQFYASLLERHEDSDPPTEAKIAALHGLAGCYAKLDRYAESLELHKRELAALEALGRGDEAGDATLVMSNLGFVARALGREGEALAWYRKAVKLERAAAEGADTRGLADALANLGVGLAELGQFDRAVEVAAEAVAMRRRLADGRPERNLARAIVNLASIEYQRGDLPKAIRLAEEAVAMQRRVDGLPRADLFNSLINLGFAQQESGRLGEMLSSFEEAMEIATALARGRDSALRAEAMTFYASALDQTGQADRALQLTAEAVAMTRRLQGETPLPALASRLIDYSGRLHDHGRFDDALDAAEEAGAILEKTRPDQPTLPKAQALQWQAVSLAKLDRTDEALKRLGEAVEIAWASHDGEPSPGLIPIMRDLATLLYMTGAQDDAIDKTRAVAKLSEAMDAPAAWREYSGLGWLLLGADRFGEGIVALEKAVEGYDRWRQRVGGTEAEQFALSAGIADGSPREGLVWGYALMLDLAKAVEILEADRSVTLLSILQRSARASVGGVAQRLVAETKDADDPALRRRAATLAEASDRASMSLRQAMARATIEPTPGNRKAVEAAERQYRRLRREVLDLLASHDAPDVRPATIEQVRGMLGPGDRVVYYLATERGTAVFSIGPDEADIYCGRPAWPDGSGVTRASLSRSIDRYMQALQMEGRTARIGRERRVVRKSGTAEGHRLFEALVPDALWADLREARVVYVIPAGPMHRLPMETLLLEPANDQTPADERRYWIDEGPMIVYTPSATVLLNRRKAREAQLAARRDGAGPAHRMLAVGDPIYDRDAPARENAVGSLRFGADLKPLPGTRREVRTIAEAIGGDDERVVTLLGEEATQPRLFDAAADARYIHIATHGLVESGPRAPFSRLALTQPTRPTADDTGFLTLMDLFDRWGGRLRSTELVVLSACDSVGGDAKGRNLRSGEGIFGLPWGFMYAGSTAVVASLWPVDDEMTAELMGDFYERLGTEGDHQSDELVKLRAFTRARQALRAKQPEPYFWAPFIYMGDPR